MQFENKIAFYFLAIIPVLVMLFYAYINWRNKAITRMGDRALVEQLMQRNSVKRKWIKFMVLMGACLFIILGLANLRMGSKKQKVKGESAEIMICFDVSNSMLAEDVKPSRLAQAKLSAAQLIERLSSNRIGLIVFAGESYVQMPLTSDSRAALMYLNNINTGTITNQGTAIGS
ncbi:MAG: VWA domain-containing protein, partial [Chitinophagales bacterium]